MRGLGNVKSMWGKFSSSASNAFTAVQGAYGDVTREVKGMAASQGWSAGSNADGKELESRGSSMMDYGEVRKDAEASWARTTEEREAQETPSWAADTQVPTERWKTDRVSQSLSSLSLENPWQTSSQTLPSSGSRLREASSALPESRNIENSVTSSTPRREATLEASSSQSKKGDDSDPLGVL